MSRKRAFTLIELLVVVAIIALLISVLLPSLKHAREQAKTTVCLSNQKTMALGFVLYAHENEDAVPRSFTDEFGWVDWPKWADGRYLTNGELRVARDIEPHLRGIRDGTMFPYTQLVEVYHCPSDLREMRDPAGGFLAYRTYSMPNCMNGDYNVRRYFEAAFRDAGVVELRALGPSVRTGTFEWDSIPICHIWGDQPIRILINSR